MYVVGQILNSKIIVWIIKTIFIDIWKYRQRSTVFIKTVM